ncbi:peptidoglycan-binding domain-containing protein [Herbaspirillum frisingense]|nr:peptidoglycan-binding domain-containing protein [Herbaspirillum frisingense]
MPERTVSGREWVSRFPGSSSIADLDSSFGAAVASFIAALRTAGARVVVSATYRPSERAYLMHWAWKIKHKKVSPAKVPHRAGVDIEWDHQDDEASIAAASAMVDAYGMSSLKIAPALRSRHTERKAIDMTISWSLKELVIVDAFDAKVKIASLPRTGMNAELHTVGLSYGVIKFLRGAVDKPHWSSDGA